LDYLRPFDPGEIACGICGEGIEDGGHMVEECPNESEAEEARRHAAERDHRPTLMPFPRRARPEGSRQFMTICCGVPLRARLEQVHPPFPTSFTKTEQGGALIRAEGLLVGYCERCGEAVSRMNPFTWRGEWLNGADPSTPFLAENLRELESGP
jgi:hypothetical protein